MPLLPSIATVLAPKGHQDSGSNNDPAKSFCKLDISGQFYSILKGMIDNNSIDNSKKIILKYMSYKLYNGDTDKLNENIIEYLERGLQAKITEEEAKKIFEDENLKNIDWNGYCKPDDIITSDQISPLVEKLLEITEKISVSEVLEKASLQKSLPVVPAIPRMPLNNNIPAFVQKTSSSAIQQPMKSGTSLINRTQKHFSDKDKERYADQLNNYEKINSLIKNGAYSTREASRIVAKNIGSTIQSDSLYTHYWRNLKAISYHHGESDISNLTEGSQKDILNSLDYLISIDYFKKNSPDSTKILSAHDAGSSVPERLKEHDYTQRRQPTPDLTTDQNKSEENIEIDLD
jgi:hypothetical protein